MMFLEKEWLILYIEIIIVLNLLLLYIKIRRKRKAHKREKKLMQEIKDILNSDHAEKNIYDLIEKEKNKIDLVNKDVKKVLSIMDDLLGKLPEEDIEKFSKSRDFELYQKTLTKFNIGE